MVAPQMYMARSLRAECEAWLWASPEGPWYVLAARTAGGNIHRAVISRQADGRPASYRPRVLDHVLALFDKHITPVLQASAALRPATPDHIAEA
jgi:hypothetical protein